MKAGHSVVLLVSVLSLGVACERWAPEVPSAPSLPPSGEDGLPSSNHSEPVDFFTGVATFGHEVRSFRPCGEEEDLWFLDPAGEVSRLHGEFAPGQSPYEEVFMALTGTVGPPMEEGFGVEYSGTIRPEVVQYAAGEGFGCDSDWSGFQYRAYGNEPFWDLEVTRDGLRLRRLGEAEHHWDSLRVEASGTGPAGESVLAVPLPYSGLTQLRAALESQEVDVLYIAPLRAVNLEGLLEIPRAMGFLSATGVPDYVERGVPVGVGSRGGRPSILINTEAAESMGADFSSELLKLAEIVEAVQDQSRELHPR